MPPNTAAPNRLKKERLESVWRNSPSMPRKPSRCLGGGARSLGMYECVPRAEVRIATAINTAAAIP